MTPRRFAPLFLLCLLVALPASAQADGRVASAIGVKQVNGEPLYVDVVVAVPAGKSAREATDKALSQQGARRVKPPWAGSPGGPNGGGGGGGEEYFYTGLEWSDFPVIQNYNPANQPSNVNGALALGNTHSEWSNISRSAYSMRYGDENSERCPSLVKECRGPQVQDLYNDVGWLALSGNTLGVTWYTLAPSAPEADMALNTRFPWDDTCDSSGIGYDVETVYLHENGHVAGLDHVTTRTDTVMYPSYTSPQCELYDYDKRSLANLYPR